MGFIRAAWLGRLELHSTPLLRSRSESCRRSDLQFRQTSGVRSCPLLSVVCRSAADPARTAEVRPLLVVDASGAAVVTIRDGMVGRRGKERQGRLIRG